MNKRNSYILGAVIAVIILVGVLSYYYLFVLPTSASIPAGVFVKVSNEDYAPLGKIEIYVQSWIGCPVGAAASWAIYLLISHYGKVEYYAHYSDPYDKSAPNIPGLIFLNFTPNSSIDFHIAYLYNEYLNATPNGTPIAVSQLIQVGEEELEHDFPAPIAQLIIKYETQVPIKQYGKPSALYVSPPHLNFAILITGPNGTYILTTPLVNPKTLEGYNISYVMSHLSQIQSIVNGYEELYHAVYEDSYNPNTGVSCPLVILESIKRVY
ncbi:MAG: DUF929 domain-containing protein [Sulfolobaceae archaeon]|nr:DUF929 domain-containing protein [Sulfolobaceae archaeon]